MMLADVVIAVMMKLAMNDAGFFGSAKAGSCNLLTMTSLTIGNGGIHTSMPALPQLRRRQTGASERARCYWSLSITAATGGGLASCNLLTASTRYLPR